MTIWLALATGIGFSVAGFFAFGPEAVAGAVDEDVFQGRLADGDGLNFAGEGFDHVGDEAVAILSFQADLSGKDLGVDLEALADALGERVWIGGVKKDDIAADFALEFCRRSESHQLALIQDGKAV